MGEREHDLKTWPGPFQAVRDGLKPWELRKNDRDYRVGDLLRLREWCPDIEDYSGAVEERLVKWMLEGPAFGLPDGYVIMSLAKADAILSRSGWRPIETAPRDGTLIDVWCPGIGRVADVQWEPFVNDFARAVTIEGEPGWTHYPNAPPTHWQPLPTPPADGGG